MKKFAAILISLVTVILVSCGITDPNAIKLVNNSDYQVSVWVSEDYNSDDGSLLFVEEVVAAHSDKSVTTKTSNFMIRSYSPSATVDMQIDNSNRQVVFTNSAVQ